MTGAGGGIEGCGGGVHDEIVRRAEDELGSAMSRVMAQAKTDRARAIEQRSMKSKRYNVIAEARSGLRLAIVHENLRYDSRPISYQKSRGSALAS